MGTFWGLVAVGVFIYVSLKVMNKREKENSRRLIDDEIQQIVDRQAEQGIKRTSADILEELLEDDLWQVIRVDAELIFKHANFKDQYYLHATHYFPEREEVYGENANGKIVWVDLYGQKEATHPDTGERIPGIKRYLRQNAIK